MQNELNDFKYRFASLEKEVKYNNQHLLLCLKKLGIDALPDTKPNLVLDSDSDVDSLDIPTINLDRSDSTTPETTLTYVSTASITNQGDQETPLSNSTLTDTNKPYNETNTSQENSLARWRWTLALDANSEEIREQRKSYAEGLTIHGLARIIDGPRLGRAIWFVLIIASFTIAVLITKQHWDDFLANGSVTNTRLVMEKQIPFPTISVCNYAELNRARLTIGKVKLHTSPSLTRTPSMKKCGQNLSSCLGGYTTLIKVENVSADYTRIEDQNSLVSFDNVTNCFNVRGYTQTIPSDFLTISLVANRTGDVWTEVYINPATETFLEATPTVYWTSEGFYHINVNKKAISRLGLPYTDCVEGNGTISQNKFIGNYTVTKCKKGCLLEALFKSCGAIPEMYKKHLREPHKFVSTQPVNKTEAEKCLKEIKNSMSIRSSCDTECMLQPCYEENIKMAIDYHWSPDRKNVLEMAFTFPSLLQENVDEIPSYTWEELFANFGGCLGLMTGASVLSVFELLIFIGLALLERCGERRNRKVAPIQND